MASARNDTDQGHIRRATRSKHDPDETSVDSGYGGSATAPSKMSKGHPARGHHAEPSKPDRSYDTHDRHDTPRDRGGADSDSESDYDPRAKFYLTEEDDPYRDISFHSSEASRDAQSSKSRGDRRKAEDSDSHRRSKQHRHGSSSTRPRPRPRRTPSSDGSDFDDHRPTRYHSSRSRTSRSPSDAGSRRKSSRRQSDAPRRDSRGHRSLSTVPSESSWESEEPSEKSHTSRARSGSRPSNSQRKRGGESSVRIGALDENTVLSRSIKEKLLEGVDLKSVGKVGLDAAAVAAIKIAVGTQIPWKQRIPKTIAVGAAAALTDFLVTKTNFKPKGMMGTMYARQLIEISLANLIINPVSNKVTTAATNAKGKIVPGAAGGGGGGGGGRSAGAKGRR